MKERISRCWQQVLVQLWLLERYSRALITCLSPILSTWIKYPIILQPTWVTDEEFGSGYLDSKPTPSLSIKSSVNSAPLQSSSSIKISQNPTATLHPDFGNSAKDQLLKAKPADGRLEKTESVTVAKLDAGILKVKGGSLINGSDTQSSLPSTALQSGISRSTENLKQVDESVRVLDENIAKISTKYSTEFEVLFKTLFLFRFMIPHFYSIMQSNVAASLAVASRVGMWSIEMILSVQIKGAPKFHISNCGILYIYVLLCSEASFG